MTHQGIQAKVDDQFEPANEARERPLSDLITDLLNRLDISCNCGGSYSIVETSKQFCGARSPQERLTALLTWFSLTWNRVIILFDKYQCCYLRHSTCELVYPFQITSVVPWLFQTGFVSNINKTSTNNFNQSTKHQLTIPAYQQNTNQQCRSVN